MSMRASKRGATSDLNHENWNQEEETEDPGIYESATSDVINRRKIRVARRRFAGLEESATTGGLFKSFTGFAGSTGLAGAAVPNFNFGGEKAGDDGPAAKRPAPSFSFGGDKTAGDDRASKLPATGFSFGAVKEKADEPPAKVPVFQFGAASSSVAASFSFGAQASKEQAKAKPLNEASKEEDVSTRDRHLHLLRSLNLSVNKWISSHVDKDPYCDLTPVFADYEKHLREIERKYPYDAGDVNEALIEADQKKAEKPQRDAKSNSSISKPIPSVELTPANGRDSAPPQKAAPFSFLRSPADKPSASKPPTVAANFGLSSAQLTAVSEDKESGEEEEEEEKEKEKKKKKKEKEEEEKPSTGLPFGASKPFSFGLDAALKKSKPDGQEEEEPEKEKPAPTLFSGMNFNFGAAAATSATSLGSSLSSTPFSFGLSGPTGPSPFGAAASTATTEEEEKPYEPPKPEVKEIKEDGAVLTKRCKLFYKSDDSWNDKGVGNLHLKPIEPGKVQAIIRADTNLGTILLNVMLTSIIPITKQKNNLTLLCIPSPPMKPVKAGEEAPMVPMPLLVRFKTEADCDEVLKEVERLREDKK